ncbi:hypothetical protein AB4463_11890 [Vibrio cyclitrophicus]
MKPTYKTRADQSQTNYLYQKSLRQDIDSLLDGVEVPRPMYAENWTLESKVHQSVKLTDDVRSTRNFVGPQTNIVRDDLRRKSFSIHIEGDKNTLILSEINNSKITNQSVIDEDVWRADLALDKYSGKVSTLYIKEVNGIGVLFFNGVVVPTLDTDIDFPFISISQVPIGHVPEAPSPFSIISYKSRKSRKVYYRTFSDAGFGEEQILITDDLIGGAPLAAVGNKVVFYVNKFNDGIYQPCIVISNDGGATLSIPDEIDIKSVSDVAIQYQPLLSAPIIDYSGMVHIPISVGFKDGSRLLDILVEDATATVAIESLVTDDQASIVGAAAFPKTVCKSVIMFNDENIPLKQDFRFGDGTTDGVGVITTLLHSGQLYTSNSQSGGASYPEKVHLNHEMLDIACFSATECFTTGIKPNMVSMDYIFLEAIEKNRPISGELHLETWDMPLPIPQGSASLMDDNTIELTIHNNGNFLPGGTDIKIDPSLVKVTEVILEDHRRAFVKFETIGSEKSIKGLSLNVESRNNFYFHKLNLTIK